MAIGQHGPQFYSLLRPTMFGIGAIVAADSWNAVEPTWVAATFFLAGAIFFAPLGGFWPIANTLIAVTYLTHLAWLGLQAIGWA